MNLELLQSIYPRSGKARGATGLIPMSYFEQNEAAIRKVMRAEGLRAWYRGSRKRLDASCTRRADAHSVVLYRK